MPDNLKVSVCIPIYNGARYLRETLDSVVCQQDIDLQIVVRDDGSQDGSMKIIAEYGKKHPKHHWSILSSDSRLGMAANWNACLQASSGDYVKVMGQDDLIYEGILSAQASILAKHANVSLVVSGCDITTARGKKLFKRPRKRESGIYPGHEIAKDCLVNRANLVGEPVTVMARRDDFLKEGGFSPNHRYYIDLEKWLRLLQLGDCAVISESQCSFRIHGKAVSSSSQTSDYDQFDKLPGALDVLKALTPLQRGIRAGKARLSTLVRSRMYQFFG